VLFADEQKETIAECDNVVTPVKRSESAKQKEQTHRTSDGLDPISSFRDILKTLFTITRSRAKVKDHKKETSKPPRLPPPTSAKYSNCLEPREGCSQ
jgi:hypothetical protein